MKFLMDYWGWYSAPLGFGVAYVPAGYRWLKGKIEAGWKKLP